MDNLAQSYRDGCIKTHGRETDRCAGVTHDDQVVGIISERDYARKVILRGKSSVNTHVKEIMTDKVYYVGPKSTAEECLILTTQQSIRHLPVLEMATGWINFHRRCG